MYEPFVVVAAALLGAVVGSFLNVVIYRLPEGRSLGGRSLCLSCGERIPWFRNIPVLGWFLLRGRAACCGARLPFRYPLVELLTAVLFAVLAWHPPFHPIAEGDSLDPEGALAFAFHAAFLSLLVANAFIDIDHRILPDALTKPGMALGIAASYLVPGIAGYVIEPDPHGLSPELSSLLSSLLGLLAGFALVFAIRAGAGRVFGREAMGFGDVKFLAMIGAFTGWQAALLAFFLACLSGAVIGLVHRVLTRDSMIPFGPFLALGALCSLMGSGPILGFLFETWPAWQRRAGAAPWILGGAAILSSFALVILVRRRRGSS
ncbi:MAG: A24 family peptidase [Planctomycetota bacterium]